MNGQSTIFESKINLYMHHPTIFLPASIFWSPRLRCSSVRLIPKALSVIKVRFTSKIPGLYSYFCLIKDDNYHLFYSNNILWCFELKPVFNYEHIMGFKCILIWEYIYRTFRRTQLTWSARWRTFIDLFYSI